MFNLRSLACWSRSLRSGQVIEARELDELHSESTAALICREASNTETKSKSEPWTFEVIWDLPVNGTLLCTNYNKNSVIFGSPGKIKRSQIQESDLANVESLALIKTSVQLARESGFSVITGSWNVPGSPTAVIIDIADVKLRKNVLNEKLKLLESVIEAKIPEADQQALAAIVFNYSVVEFLRIFHRVLHEQQTNVMAENNLKSSVHFHDWTCGIGLIFTHHGTHLKMSTVFMIDAPVVAYETKTPVANETAKERNVYHRLAIERNAANLADFFGPPFP